MQLATRTIGAAGFITSKSAFARGGARRTTFLSPDEQVNVKTAVGFAFWNSARAAADASSGWDGEVRGEGGDGAPH